MLKVEADTAAGYVEITVDGAIDNAEYDAVVAAVDDLLKTHDTVNAVGVVRALGWVDMGVWPKDLAFHLTHRHWLKRFALVTDTNWVAQMTRVFAPLYPAEIRIFGLSDLDDARIWAKVGNVSRAAA